MQIIVGAFKPNAVLGGAAGITVREAIRYGVARGLFSNEAGMGSTPHAHARATAASPHDQGLAAMISVFIDTFVILNLTVFSILTTGCHGKRKEWNSPDSVCIFLCTGKLWRYFSRCRLFFFAFSTILAGTSSEPSM